MSTNFDDDRTQAIPVSQAPTETFAAAAQGPAFAAPAAGQRQWYAQPEPDPVAPVQPDGTPRYAGTGFTAEERAQRARGRGPVYNWFRTGDGKLSLDSEQGKALSPAIPDGWSVAGLICAFFVPLAGLILSMVAFADAKKNHRLVHGTAVGGFIVSILGCIGWTLYWIFVIVAMAALTNAVNSNPYGG